MEIATTSLSATKQQGWLEFRCEQYKCVFMLRIVSQNLKMVNI